MSKSMIFKKLFLVLLLLYIVISMKSLSSAEEKIDVFSVSGQETYGTYNNSIFRHDIYTETFNLNYAHGVLYGGGLTASISNISTQSSPVGVMTSGFHYNFNPIGEIRGYNVGGTVFYTPMISGGSFVGGKVNLLRIHSSDANSNDTYIPYVSLIFKSADLSKYFDIGYARTGFRDSAADQYTLTGGFSLFKDYVWFQTRLCFIDLSKLVSNSGETFAVEEHITFFAIPEKLNFTVSGLVGKKIYGYDPDLNSSYNLADILTGSMGITANYNFTKNVAVFVDVTHEFYRMLITGFNDNNYGATYFTGGVRGIFF